MLCHPMSPELPIDTCSGSLLLKADRVACGVNNFTSIPAAASIDFIDLATVYYAVSSPLPLFLQGVPKRFSMLAKRGACNFEFLGWQ